MVEFEAFPKVARLSRTMVVTEKIDGTNAQVFISEDGVVQAGSRSRWITPEQDNFGFARWVQEHEDGLRELGPGRHFGEWWGSGIQRGYGLPKGEKRFSLFNTKRWNEDNPPPACCYVVPVLTTADKFSTAVVDAALYILGHKGSQAAPGFMRPEGVMVYHSAGNVMFKKTIEKDDAPKGQAA